MKEKFIARYEDAVRAYLNYPGNGEGKIVKNAIVSECKKILMEEFGMDETEIGNLYQAIYHSKTFRYSWLVKTLGEPPVDENQLEAVDFYYTAIHDWGMGLIDADDYAYLNTLLRYDIGAERARKISSWVYESMEVVAYDAIKGNEEGRALLEKIDAELALHLDFSHWLGKTPEYFEYGFKTYTYKD